MMTLIAQELYHRCEDYWRMSKSSSLGFIITLISGRVRVLLKVTNNWRNRFLMPK